MSEEVNSMLLISHHSTRKGRRGEGPAESFHQRKGLPPHRKEEQGEKMNQEQAGGSERTTTQIPSVGIS
jgi:hypothetical protein